MFRKADWADGTNEVKGKAATVVNISILTGQVFSTLIITPVVDFMDDGNYFMFIPCIQAAATFFLACFLTTRNEN